jgi:hypothetical protein
MQIINKGPEARKRKSFDDGWVNSEARKAME